MIKNKWHFIASIIVTLLVLSACGNTDEPAQADNETENQTEEKANNSGDNVEEIEQNPNDNEESTEEREGEAEIADDGIRKIDELFHVNGLDVLIESIEFKRNELDIYVRITNVSDNTLSFYPDQGAIVVGNRQIDADFWGSDGSLAGEIYSGVEKEGFVPFEVGELNADEIEDIRLMLGQVYNEDTYSAEDFAEVISLD